MQIEVIQMNTWDADFDDRFYQYRDTFLDISKHSYPEYYGDGYQIERLLDSRCVIFLALVDKKLVGFSYLKENRRRGGTAIYPVEYRRKGIGYRLVNDSLDKFPEQYTILSTKNRPMLELMLKCGFRQPRGTGEMQQILGDDFNQLFDIRVDDMQVVFSRRSDRRDAVRENLTMLHTFPEKT